MSGPLNFKGWCIAYGCQRSLYIGSLDDRHDWAAWRPQYDYNGSDVAGTHLLEFGFIGTGNPAALPPGVPDSLLSKGTTASNHANALTSQITLQHVLGPAAFGLPADYVFTVADGQRCVVLEDPKNQGLCLWDGVLRQMILAKAPPAPAPKPAPPSLPAPLPAPAPAPAPQPAPAPAAQGLSPLTPAGLRVIELERVVVQFAIRLMPASWSSLPTSGADLAACLQTALIPLRFLTIPLLKTWRRAAAATGDPRPMPLEDL